MSNKLKRRSPNYSSNSLQSAGNAAAVICCTNVRADPKYFLLENNNSSSSSGGCGGSGARQRLRLGPARTVPGLGIPGGQLGAPIKPPSAASSRGFFGVKPAVFFVPVMNKVLCSRSFFVLFFFFLLPLVLLCIECLPQLIRKYAELLPG